jgi:DNA-binding NarL/FixJ family response regulator
MRAVFEQSWHQLAAAEREVFQRLAVFQGGFRRAAAEAVAGADLLALRSLVDKSLLRLGPSGRYGIHEALRQFALARLDERPDLRRQVQDRHAAYYADVLATLEPLLTGGDPRPALAEIDAEIDNVRAAWQWAAGQALGTEIRKAMGSLLLYYQARSRMEEGAAAFDRAIRSFETRGGLLLAELCAHGGWFSAEIVREAEAASQYRQAISELRGRDVASSTSMALAGATFLFVSDLPWQPSELRELYEGQLLRSRQAGDRWAIAWSAYALGALSYQLRDDAASEPLLRESIMHFQATNSRWLSTWPRNQLALTLTRLGRHEDAIAAYKESLAICRETGDQGGVTFVLSGLGSIAASRREYVTSQRYLFDAIRVAYESRRQLDMCWNICELAETLAKIGQTGRAVELIAFVQHSLPVAADKAYVSTFMSNIATQLAPAAVEAAWHRGEVYSPTALMAELADEYGSLEDTGPAPKSTVWSLVEPLTPREFQLLTLIAAGLSNRDIAAQLVITVGAVKKHLNNIFGKLQVQSRTQAVARARTLGLLGPDAK